MITIKELELFYHLCDNPHVSQLAKKIEMSQSAISLAIKSLETKLNEPLFDRIGKKLVLNARGRFFKDKTYHHFLALKDGQSSFSNDKFSGRLQIASSKTIGNFIMPQILFRFLSRYQHCSIENDILNSTEIIHRVVEGKIDIGFIESSSNHTDIIKEKFGSDELVVVSSDRALTKHAYYIDQLFNKKWILRESGSGTREIFLENIGEISSDLKVFMNYKDSQEIKSILTQNTDAITCISKYVVEKELLHQELFRVKIKNISFKRDFFIIYHKNIYRSKLITKFIEFVKNSFCKTPSSHPFKATQKEI